ncbi:hypothetical protein B0H11DRAFT_2123495 [Mycena galericulata]|nr:hypothetical protein B0H11DRAFT_2123495 [Mycena galericulata]
MTEYNMFEIFSSARENFQLRSTAAKIRQTCGPVPNASRAPLAQIADNCQSRPLNDKQQAMRNRLGRLVRKAHKSGLSHLRRKEAQDSFKISRTRKVVRSKRKKAIHPCDGADQARSLHPVIPQALGNDPDVDLAEIPPTMEELPRPMPSQESSRIRAFGSVPSSSPLLFMDQKSAQMRGESAGLATSRVLKRPPSNSQASDEPAGNRVRVPAPVHIYAGKTLTDKQSAALVVASNNNVVVSGEVGSGKSLLVRAIADTYATVGNRVLVLSLRPDSFADVRNKNVVIFTPTQLIGQLYPLNEGLPAVRRSNTPAKWRGDSYGRIVIDDFQTWTNDRYWLLLSALAALPSPPLLALLGCRRQEMAGYPPGDVRFLEHARELLVSPHPWQAVDLPQSIRISIQNAAYINHMHLMHLKQLPYLSGSHEGPMPRVFDVASGESNYNAVVDRLLSLIKENLTSCVITAPTVRNLWERNPLLQIMNRLTKLDIPLAQPRGDHMPPTAADLFGKVAVLNYNQLRGREYSVVIAVCTERCPDGVVAALTTASKHLIVIHWTEHGSLPRELVAEYAEFTRIPLNAPDQPRRLAYASPIPNHLGVWNMVEKVAYARLEQLLAEGGIHTYEVSPPLPQGEHLDPRDSIPTDSGKQETVSDINGDMVTLAFDFYRARYPPGAPVPCAMPVEHFAQQAINNQADRSGFIQRKTAMAGRSLDWMAKDLPRAVDRLAAQFLPQEVLQHEVEVSYRLDLGGYSVTIKGWTDIISETPSGTTFWEVKLVRNLMAQHVVQVLVYAFIWAATNNRPFLPRIYLFNARDGQKLEIGGNLELENVRMLVMKLVRAQRSREELSLDEFLERCAETKAAVERQQYSTQFC